MLVWGSFPTQLPHYPGCAAQGYSYNRLLLQKIAESKDVFSVYITLILLMKKIIVNLSVLLSLH